MIWKLYMIILSYFLLGFFGFFLINRKKEPAEARNRWIKYATYFLIIHMLFFSIAFAPGAFRMLVLLIIAGSFYEMVSISVKSVRRKPSFLLISLIVLGILSVGFYMFSGLNSNIILFSFLIVSIFDSFSQITGQLWGRKKLFRKISPQKTVEGFIGGIIAALLSSYLLSSLLTGTIMSPMRLAAGIILFAFLGDMASSYFKRKYNIKDFSALIPGHGGFLDRFDSLIAGGAFVALNGIFVSV